MSEPGQSAGLAGRTRLMSGGIDIVVNNASAIDLTPTADIAMKRYIFLESL